MAIPKRRNQEAHDSPAAKKRKTNTTFTIDDFMADFPPTDEPLDESNGSPLPSTVLGIEEFQDGNERKPPRRSTFNIKLPVQLKYHDNAPYDWMKNQYSHCIIPELGEEYDFAFGSPTFHCLRDLHNARVRIRDGEFLPDYQICNLAARWVCLEEKDRPASDGYLANGEVFVATCLPIGDIDEDALQEYFEMSYSKDLSAQNYIPRSKYSVHFVGQPNENEEEEIQAVTVGSVLIRNTRTGQMVHIDTGEFDSREDRARDARDALRAWLEFQKEKCPTADLGPISNSEPLVLDVDKETDQAFRSLHAIVSASLFLRRRITNWGDVKAFRSRGKPTSAAVANHALQSISGWLGLRSSARRPDTRYKNGVKPVNSFQDNYDRDALFGRKAPAPVSQRIFSAKKGAPPVYNDEDDPVDNASDHEDSLTDGSSVSSDNSVDSDQNTGVADQDTAMADQDTVAADQDTVVADQGTVAEQNTVVTDQDTVVAEQSTVVAEQNIAVADQNTNNKDIISNHKQSDSEVAKDKGSAIKKSVSWKDPVTEELDREEPKEPKEPNHKGSDGDDHNHEVNGEKSSSDSETSGNDNDDQGSPAST